MGMQRQAWIELQQQKQSESLDLFEQFWDDFKRLFPEGTSPWTQGLTEYQTGGAVGRTGPALLHRGEYVLNPQVTSALNAMMSGFSQQRLVAAAAGGGGRSVTMQMANGAIQVMAAPGQSPEDVAMSVRREFENMMREMT